MKPLKSISLDHLGAPPESHFPVNPNDKHDALTAALLSIGNGHKQMHRDVPPSPVNAPGAEDGEDSIPLSLSMAQQQANGSQAPKEQSKEQDEGEGEDQGEQEGDESESEQEKEEQEQKEKEQKAKDAERWHAYACAALSAANSPQSPSADIAGRADNMLAAFKERFPDA